MLKDGKVSETPGPKKIMTVHRYGMYRVTDRWRGIRVSADHRRYPHFHAGLQFQAATMSPERSERLDRWSSPRGPSRGLIRRRRDLKLCPPTTVAKTQYTPPTPTRLNCRVASASRRRRRCVQNSQLANGDRLPADSVDNLETEHSGLTT